MAVHPGDIVTTDGVTVQMPYAKWEAIKAHIDRLEIALHRIAGHGNITAEKAREIAAEAVVSKRQ